MLPSKKKFYTSNTCSNGLTADESEQGKVVGSLSETQDVDFASFLGHEALSHEGNKHAGQRVGKTLLSSLA